MSKQQEDMNLFWKKFIRILNTTKSFERKIEATLGRGAAHLFENVTGENQGDHNLSAYVQSEEFIQKKKLYKNTKYKDTEENRVQRQYEKLLNNPDIRLYFQTKNSTIFREYLEFKSNPASLNLSGLSVLEVSDRIEKLKTFEQSREYKVYTQVHDSLLLREFEELKARVDDPIFQTTNAFWANPQRWYTTPEYRMEQRYLEQVKPSSKSFRSKNKISFLKKYSKFQLTFSENFDWFRLEDSRWSAGFHSENTYLKGNYSFVNEQQANNAGRNVSTSASGMTLRTVQLPIRTTAWDVQKGFVEKDFQYTSDVIQTSATFKQKYGVFSVKVRCSGLINHAIWLKAGRKLPHINLFHFNGSEITLGNAGQHKLDGISIRGIDQSQFYIYALEWTPRALVWYINNIEVFRTTENVPHIPLSLGINSFIPNSTEAVDGKMEVEWVKVFSVRE